MSQSIRISKQVFSDHTLDPELERTIEESLPEFEGLFRNLFYDAASQTIVVRDKPERVRFKGLNKKEQLQFATSYLRSGEHVVAVVQEGNDLGVVAWRMLPTQENLQFIRRVEGENCQILNSPL